MVGKITLTVTDSGPSEKTLTGEIPVELFMSYWGSAVKELGEDAHIEGFRSGHIPEKVLVQNVGESAVLYEMAERTLAAEYPGMLAEQNIDAIGRPEITITKLAKDNPLGFAIKTAVTPEVKLPDYHRIAEQEFAQEAEPVTVSNQEVESVLNELREARRNDGMELPASAAADDEFAHSVGKFASLDELKTKIQENLQEEKEVKTRDKRRMRALEAILAQTPITVPRALVAAETEKMLAELRANIEHMGLKFPDYLAHIKKTEDELRAVWQADAERRVSLGLILAKIAEMEKLAPNEEEISHEVAHLLEHYPDADPSRLHTHVAGQLTNELVLKFLENQK
ncbi:MAG TPA: hypothetical protein DCZ84_01125 [Candidatus Vogelbacteria bacterium]|uniref:Trigger factor n=1 Tax=Candidatus Vogelbacteria bacterium RIFOXYD1_FULL_51_18 TaxID=1802440 RepID=A0A1G2QLC0_9BACT|nr:MAG: Trigger factor [Parcubacteria group bacterium GW2011_GWC1_51_35]KKW25214.1 MAG: Trigger factor [Parcubacteria group bacterium GW2011_GWF2_52_12]KKW34878.1 MAG: Trigger factor [Parcubacteria group bacterium GW2011_GWB1_53_43]OHA61326.1 MAG: hypothetical protein A2569_00530 [Candidatus Vogelbacteria bacterium RIFOXYD1_FULL_51_18]HBB65227.1 hypothetical protein [Candidatus Vogelbacteria bacterium]